MEHITKFVSGLSLSLLASSMLYVDQKGKKAGEGWEEMYKRDRTFKFRSCTTILSHKRRKHANVMPVAIFVTPCTNSRQERRPPSVSESHAHVHGSTRTLLYATCTYGQQVTHANLLGIRSDVSTSRAFSDRVFAEIR